MSQQRRIEIPPRLGGGNFILRDALAGEVDDSLKEHPLTSGRESAAVVDHQIDMLHRTIVNFRGKPLPVGEAREAWWREQTAAMRHFLLGCYSRMNSVAEDEIADFFGKAEVVKATPPTDG